MTRILFLIKSLGRGGAEQLLTTMASQLDSSRFDAEVAYVRADQSDLAAEIEAAGWPVTCLATGRPGGWAIALHRLLRDGGFDLVHVHSPHVAAVARLLLARRRTPVVYTEHNEWPMYRRATYWANALTYPRNDRVLAVSDQARESIRYPGPLRLLPMPPVETLYHGIDLAAFDAAVPATPFDRASLGLPPGALVVCTVANFRPEKGHTQLLRAAQVVSQRIPQVRFVLVGGGPGEAAVRAEVAALGLGDVVVFSGYRSDAVQIASSADLFVLPSLHEGLPIALIEALAASRPVVVTDAGGMPEVVESGAQGLVVARGDSAALADAIVTLLGDPERRGPMGAAGRRRAADFDMRRAVARLERLYDEVTYDAPDERRTARRGRG